MTRPLYGHMDTRQLPLSGLKPAAPKTGPLLSGTELGGKASAGSVYPEPGYGIIFSVINSAVVIVGFLPDPTR